MLGTVIGATWNTAIGAAEGVGLGLMAIGIVNTIFSFRRGNQAARY